MGPVAGGGGMGSNPGSGAGGVGSATGGGSGGSPTSTIFATGSAPSNVASAVPICPAANGRIFTDGLGQVYEIGCGRMVTDQTLSTSSVSSLASCIDACDMYNFISFNSPSPCLAVSFYSTLSTNNCELKNGITNVTASGVDSALLVSRSVGSGNGTTGNGGTGGNGDYGSGSYVGVSTVTAPGSGYVTTVLPGGVTTIIRFRKRSWHRSRHHNCTFWGHNHYHCRRRWLWTRHWSRYRPGNRTRHRSWNRSRNWARINCLCCLDSRVDHRLQRTNHSFNIWCQHSYQRRICHGKHSDRHYHHGFHLDIHFRAHNCLYRPRCNSIGQWWSTSSYDYSWRR
jgi:hypothetical protein